MSDPGEIGGVPRQADVLETGDIGGDKLSAGTRRLFGVENGFRSTASTWQVFGGKRTNLEPQAAHLTPDTKNALCGVRRFQRLLLQKRSGDEAVTSLVTSSAGWKLCSFGAFCGQKTKINWLL